MKAITIKQPFAALIINGYKNYEFRTWKTKYRGKILIHAGLGIDSKRMKDFTAYGLEYDKGAIIGEADITDCILVTEEFNQKLTKENSSVYKHDLVGYYAWELTNIKKYDEPIYCKGNLSLWNF